MTDRLIVAGGEGSEGTTWAFDLAAGGAWVNLAPLPNAADVVRAVYDSQDRSMILVLPSLAVYSLDLATPGAPWTVLINPGVGPPPRRYPIVAYDRQRNRLLLFGGGPDTGIYDDSWALDLSGVPAWHQLAPSSPRPPARWAGVGIYDPIGDRFIIGTGSSGSEIRLNDFWALPLSDPSGWQQLQPEGPLPPARYLSAATYAPGSRELVLFGGLGSVPYNDVWNLALSDPVSWRSNSSTGPAPAPVWSHAVAYWDRADEMITYGGFNGGFYRDEVWALPETPVSGAPDIFSFSPLGGRIGDEVTIRGVRLASPTLVRIGGAVATVLESSNDLIRATVPVGAVTGPIVVENALGTATSNADFFVGELPEITFFTPDSARAGEPIEIHGNHLASTERVQIGGTGSAALEAITDTLVQVTVDSLASTGLIHLTTLVGSATSATSFVVIPDDPRPRLLSVLDVRGDQGGKVMLRWRASDFDQPRYKQITGYRVWRRAPLTDAMVSGRSQTPGQGFPRAGPDAFWENIAELPAAFLKGYAFAAPTLTDSSKAGNPFTAYFVQATTVDPFVFYNSSPDSGYSVDNLPPRAPSTLTASYGSAENAIHWHASAAADLRGYELYRDGSSTFLPSPATLIVTTAETSYTDVPGIHCYKLAAVDAHGNRSWFVAVTPEVPVGTLASLAHSDRGPDHADLTWFSGGNTGMRAHVQRRTETADWNTLGTASVDGSGFLRFDDASADGGRRYAYRLAILDDEGKENSFTSESWVELLAAARLSLALVANPSIGGRIVLGMTLRANSQASVSLFDLAGRELERRDVSTGGDGRVEVTLGSSTRLRPGLYMIRATSGDATVTRRVAVIL